jgi:hypothetical protein
MNARPVWFLDVDGVINGERHRPREWNGIGRWEHANVFTPLKEDHGPWKINYSNEVVKFIHKMSKIVDIIWLTSWNDDADGDLAPALFLPRGLPNGFEMARVDSGLLDFGMWWRAKTLAIYTLLDKGDMNLPEEERVPFRNRKVIWTDDEIEPDSVDGLMKHADVQPLCIAPLDRDGLLPENLDAIRAYVTGDASLPTLIGKKFEGNH